MKINTSTFLPTCPKCGVAIISNCEQKFCYNCGISLTWDGEQQPPRTQGDKIRAMNNRELAEYLCEKYYCTNCSIYKNSKCKDVTECWSYYSILVFVNREVKEDE